MIIRQPIHQQQNNNLETSSKPPAERSAPDSCNSRGFTTPWTTSPIQWLMSILQKDFISRKDRISVWKLTLRYASV